MIALDAVRQLTYSQNMIGAKMTVTYRCTCSNSYTFRHYTRPAEFLLIAHGQFLCVCKCVSVCTQDVFTVLTFDGVIYILFRRRTHKSPRNTFAAVPKERKKTAMAHL